MPYLKYLKQVNLLKHTIALPSLYPVSESILNQINQYIGQPYKVKKIGYHTLTLEKDGYIYRVAIDQIGKFRLLNNAQALDKLNDNHTPKLLRLITKMPTISCENVLPGTVASATKSNTVKYEQLLRVMSPYYVKYRQHQKLPLSQIILDIEKRFKISPNFEPRIKFLIKRLTRPLKKELRVNTTLIHGDLNGSNAATDAYGNVSIFDFEHSMQSLPFLDSLNTYSYQYNFSSSHHSYQKFLEPSIAIIKSGILPPTVSYFNRIHPIFSPNLRFSKEIGTLFIIYTLHKICENEVSHPQRINSVFEYIQVQLT